MELERNRTIALAFGLKPALCSDCISHALLTCPDPDQYQFAYRVNRLTEDAVNAALHTALTHLNQPNMYARVLLLDFSSAFNTVIPHKLSNQGVGSSLCTWILDFLIN